MGARFYRRYVYYLKSIGTCIVVVGGCWLFYQVRQTSQILGSAVTTNVLNLEQAQAQYIYLDDPRFKDIFMFHHENDLQSSVSERPKGLSYVIMKWWKSLHRNLAYKLLGLAKNGSREERIKAVRALTSLKHLKGDAVYKDLNLYRRNNLSSQAL